jgi:hypothetical protein
MVDANPLTLLPYLVMDEICPYELPTLVVCILSHSTSSFLVAQTPHGLLVRNPHTIYTFTSLTPIISGKKYSHDLRMDFHGECIENYI